MTVPRSGMHWKKMYMQSISHIEKDRSSAEHQKEVKKIIHEDVKLIEIPEFSQC